MKRIGGHLLPALAVIPALVVTGASLVALLSGEAGGVTASAPPVAPGGGPVLAPLIFSQAPLSSLAAVQLQPERLPRQTIQPASTVSGHTAIAPAVVRQPTVAQPQPSGNASGDRNGSNSGERRGDERDDDHKGDDDRGHGGHGDDDRHDDDHGHKHDDRDDDHKGDDDRGHGGHGDDDRHDDDHGHKHKDGDDD